jgi:multiple RNA-binding domain-containing protein 1
MASSRIFIRGLPPNITEADFRKHFSAQGREITDVKLMPQRRIGYVGYKTPEDADKAVKYFNRSYIRMSKIAVESARPISDPALFRAQSASHSKPASSPSTTIKGTAPTVDKDADSSLKKRKRDEPQAADPKLREFLHVMKEGREGAMDDGVRGGMGDGVAAVATNAVPEEESDDEYEQIPARKEKQRRVDSPEKSLASGSLPLQLKEANVVSDAKAQAPAVEGSAESKEATKPNTETQEAVPEDDDWLRSRTNRLLDLVDPDDLERTPVQGPSTTETDHAEGGDAMEITPADPPAANDVPMVETTVEAVGDEPAKDDTLESIRRTSRLFVRNLPYSATQEDLRAAFEQFGTLEEVCFKQVFLPLFYANP